MRLLKGILVLSGFVLLAYIFQMNTILWLVKNGLRVAAIAIVVVFQPELRRALEKIGEKEIFKSILPFDRSLDEIDINKNNKIISACLKMKEAKTGALIVIERKTNLKEYIDTGIKIDSYISEEILINIFEHNTPLHDGAVIIRNNRIAAASCILPISESNEISKSFGTRHRAGLGLSEVSDAIIIIVSEETGEISIALDSKFIESINESELFKVLSGIKEKE